jgi:hypothetical protein
MDARGQPDLPFERVKVVSKLGTDPFALTPLQKWDATTLIKSINNMTNNSSDRLRIENELRQAFQSAQHPGATNIVLDSTRAEDCDVAGAFGTKHWDELDPRFLAYHHEALMAFTPDAFRFYLPGFLIASLNPEDVSGNLRSTLLFVLTSMSDGTARVYCPVQYFTAEQKKAIKSYLEWLEAKSVSPSQQREIEKALLGWSLAN